MLPATAEHRRRDPAERRPRGSRRAAWELGVLQACYVLFLPPWLIVAAGATITVSNWESALAGPITFSLWLYPLVISAGAVAAWVLFVNGLVGVARMVNLVPLPWVLSGGALLVAAAIT